MARRKRRKRKQRVAREQALPNTGYLFLAALLLGALVYFFADMRGVRFGFLGSMLWLVALFATAALVLLVYARTLLPIDGDAGWYEGTRLIFYFFVYRLPPILQDFFAGFVGLTTYSDPPDDVPHSFRTLGAGVVESHITLSLAKGGKFSRAAGPGYVRLDKGERIRQVFDLRPHIRVQDVKVLTRDGIPLDTSITVAFRLRQEENYRANRQAVFLLSYTGSRDQTREIPWTERVAPLAAASLVTQLSDKTLDQLYPLDDQGTPLADIQQAVADDVVRQLETNFSSVPSPIELLSVTIGSLHAPNDVIEQRIRNWQLNWDRQINREHAEGSAEALRRINIARARAQLELLQNIVENIETMRQAGRENLSEVVRLRMLEAMESALGDGDVQSLIPQQVISALQDIQALIDDLPPEPSVRENGE